MRSAGPALAASEASSEGGRPLFVDRVRKDSPFMAVDLFPPVVASNMLELEPESSCLSRDLDRRIIK